MRHSLEWPEPEMAAPLMLVKEECHEKDGGGGWGGTKRTGVSLRLGDGSLLAKMRALSFAEGRRGAHEAQLHLQWFVLFISCSFKRALIFAGHNGSGRRQYWGNTIQSPNFFESILVPDL